MYKSQKIKEKERLFNDEGKIKCNRCDIIKSKEEFHKDKSKKIGFSSYCKTCSSERYNYLFKVCVSCGENVPKDKFINYYNVISNSVRTCKDCYDKITTIVCKSCKEEKSLGDFEDTKKSYLGKATTCKKCRSERKEFLRHKKILSNPEYGKKERERKRKEKVNRYENNLLFRLKSNLSGKIRNSLLKNGYSKKSSTYKILGCTYDEFKIHIESQWEDWMNWDNYGLYNGDKKYGWDLDHITPLSSGECEEDIIRLNHHSNIQPLCSYINRCVKRDLLEWVS